MIVWSVVLSASQADRLFLHLAICYIRVVLVFVKLVATTLSYAVSCSRFANASSIPTKLLTL